MISSLQPKRPVAGGGGSSGGTSQGFSGSKVQQTQRRESATMSEQLDLGEIGKMQTGSTEAGQDASKTSGDSSMKAEKNMEKQTEP